MMMKRIADWKTKKAIEGMTLEVQKIIVMHKISSTWSCIRAAGGGVMLILKDESVCTKSCGLEYPSAQPGAAAVHIEIL